jgi:hypothetical protein
VYRDDVCAVCGESLPPDHFYCREHAAEVDDRLHELGAILPRLRTDLRRAAELLGEVAGETWDYLAAAEPDDPDWPPAPAVRLRATPEEVAVDVDSEPGYVQVRLDVAAQALLTALADGLDSEALTRFAAACARAEGANATH